jgi:NADH:ubiquinone oxidoreductase subunit 6 (subunit J)
MIAGFLLGMFRELFAIRGYVDTLLLVAFSLAVFILYPFGVMILSARGRSEEHSIFKRDARFSLLILTTFVLFLGIHFLI